jgi:putative transposase
MVPTAADWPWSSYLATVEHSEEPACFVTNWLLANFSQNKPEAIERYKQFVAQGLCGPSIWLSLHKQIYLGNSAFIEEVQSLINENQPLSEIPSTQIKPVPDSLDNYRAKNQDRNTAICMAYQSGGYTLKEVATYFALHY